MVSFWPWRRSDPPFERTLATLASRISSYESSQAVRRRRARAVAAAWSINSIIAYILGCAALVTRAVLLGRGWTGVGAQGGIVILSGPLLILLVRRLITTYFGLRIRRAQARLEGLYTERDETIERLKAATKYDSTRELLERYGPRPGSSQSPEAEQKSLETPAISPHMLQGNDLPPTANIPHPHLLPGPSQVPDALAPGEEFSPNAFDEGDAGQHLARMAGASHRLPAGLNYNEPPPQREFHWYDRLLDVLLGEDEMLARNRYALVCGECRLVNGLAPPGLVSDTGVGRWRCAGCGSDNSSLFGQEATQPSETGVTQHAVGSSAEASREKPDADTENEPTGEESVLKSSEGASGTSTKASKKARRRQAKKERGSDSG